MPVFLHKWSYLGLRLIKCTASPNSEAVTDVSIRPKSSALRPAGVVRHMMQQCADAVLEKISKKLNPYAYKLLSK